MFSLAMVNLDTNRLGNMQEHGEDEERMDYVIAMNVVDQEDSPNVIFVPRIVNLSSTTIPCLNLDFVTILLVASELE